MNTFTTTLVSSWHRMLCHVWTSDILLRMRYDGIVIELVTAHVYATRFHRQIDAVDVMK